LVGIDDAVLSSLAGIVGQQRVLTDADSLQGYGRDWTRVHTPCPCAVVRPGSVAEVQQVVRIAASNNLAIVPSGGRTGLSGGAVACHGELVMALDRLDYIEDFSPVDRTVLCGAGVLTARLHGMTRDWVAGLKLVDGRGELLDLNRGLLKNNTGYDLRHLVIGAEGTLGVVVEATMRLARPPRDSAVMVLGTPDMDSIMRLLDSSLGALELSAFEFFSEPALQQVVEHRHMKRPFETPAPFYALLEFELCGADTRDAALSLFEDFAAHGWVLDGVISESVAQAESLWQMREDITETIARWTPYKNDIATVVSRIPAFLAEVDAVVTERYPGFEIIWFGHIGDGNVHLNILKPDDLSPEAFQRRCEDVSQWVFEIVERYGGSISAEHGVGLLKKDALHYSRSGLEIDIMRQIKRAFDPRGIMNPGKIFDS
jgi:FAD/FMN-containing dehydrogenase